MERKRLVLTPLFQSAAASLFFGVARSKPRSAASARALRRRVGRHADRPNEFHRDLRVRARPAGSGGIRHRLDQFRGVRFWSSAAQARAGGATGPTNPILPQFGGSPSSGFGSAAPGVGAGHLRRLGGLSSGPADSVGDRRGLRPMMRPAATVAIVLVAFSGKRRPIFRKMLQFTAPVRASRDRGLRA